MSTNRFTWFLSEQLNAPTVWYVTFFLRIFTPSIRSFSLLCLGTSWNSPITCTSFFTIAAIAWFICASSSESKKLDDFAQTFFFRELQRSPTDTAADRWKQRLHRSVHADISHFEWEFTFDENSTRLPGHHSEAESVEFSRFWLLRSKQSQR